MMFAEEDEDRAHMARTILRAWGMHGMSPQACSEKSFAQLVQTPILDSIRVSLTMRRVE